MNPGRIAIRPAAIGDYLELLDMQARSLRYLARELYTPRQIEGFIDSIGTMDPMLLEDGTYLVATCDGAIAASGGWSLRRPGYAARDGSGAVDPGVPVIRSVFVHPEHGRRGLGRLVMEQVERELLRRRHGTAALVATLNGVPFYAALGFESLRPVVLDLGGGERFAALAMQKRLVAARRAA